MDFISSFFSRAEELLYLIIWLGGIVYAFVNRKKHPWTSLLAGLALGILFLTGLLWSVVSVYTQYQFSAGKLPVDEYMKIGNTLSVCTFPFTVLGRLLTLAAIFWRKEDAPDQFANDHTG